METLEKKFNQQQEHVHNLQGQLDAYKTKIISPHAQVRRSAWNLLKRQVKHK
jgi:hypothetical protein